MRLELWKPLKTFGDVTTGESRLAGAVSDLRHLTKRTVAMHRWVDIVKAYRMRPDHCRSGGASTMHAELSRRKPPGQNALCQICPHAIPPSSRAEGEGDGHSTVRGDGDRPKVDGSQV